MVASATLAHRLRPLTNVGRSQPSAHPVKRLVRLDSKSLGERRSGGSWHTEQPQSDGLVAVDAVVHASRKITQASLLDGRQFLEGISERE